MVNVALHLVQTGTTTDVGYAYRHLCSASRSISQTEVNRVVAEFKPLMNWIQFSSVSELSCQKPFARQCIAAISHNVGVLIAVAMRHQVDITGTWSSSAPSVSKSSLAWHEWFGITAPCFTPWICNESLFVFQASKDLCSQLQVNLRLIADVVHLCWSCWIKG